MNKPVPALDERGEFVVAVCHDGTEVPVYTLDNGKDEIAGECRWWRLDGRSICESHPEMSIRNLPELRATVERARKMRKGKWPDYGLQITPLGAIPSPPSRPTFAEALEREANLLYEAGIAIRGSELPETDVYRALIKAVKRARRASEGSV